MVIVYTAILGGCDSIKPAPQGADLCVCFVDDPAMHDGHDGHVNGWDTFAFQTSSPRRDAWHLRCIPQELFPAAHTTVWVDASFTITDLPRLLRDSAGADIAGLRHPERSSCYEEGDELIAVGQSDPNDVKAQLDTYRSFGFVPSGLTISGVLVRSNSERVQDFNERWDAEIRRHPGDNTQLSLDYCAWMAGIEVRYLDGVYTDNPYVRYDHEDHQRRRVAYR